MIELDVEVTLSFTQKSEHPDKVFPLLRITDRESHLLLTSIELTEEQLTQMLASRTVHAVAEALSPDDYQERVGLTQQVRVFHLGRISEEEAEVKAEEERKRFQVVQLSSVQGGYSLRCINWA